MLTFKVAKHPKRSFNNSYFLECYSKEGIEKPKEHKSDKKVEDFDVVIQGKLVLLDIWAKNP